MVVCITLGYTGPVPLGPTIELTCSPSGTIIYESTLNLTTNTPYCLTVPNGTTLINAIDPVTGCEETFEVDPYVSNFRRCGTNVDCPEDDFGFNELTDLTTITNTWNRFAFLGTASSSMSNTTFGTWSGLRADGTIDSSSPTAFLYTGSSRYCGAYATPVGLTEGTVTSFWPPSCASGTLGNGKFYYNTTINKFVINNSATGTSNPPLQPVTFDPRDNQGFVGDPTCYKNLTNSTQWGVVSLSTPSATGPRYTVCGPNNTVCLAVNKLTAAGNTNPQMIRCTQNSGYENGFYSVCAYDNYVHEVTLGSENNDDDFISIVLGAVKDYDGVWGPQNVTYTLTLFFRTNNVPHISLFYSLSNSAYSFRLNDTTFNPTVVSFNNITPGTINDRELSPFIIPGTTNYIGGNWNQKGYVRAKIVKTGPQYDIYLTKCFGNQALHPQTIHNVGQPAPYYLVYSLDVTNPSTWVSAPVYADPTALLKFSGGTRYGYATQSQSETGFFDIYFSGSQVSNLVTSTQAIVSSVGNNNIYTFNEIDGCWEFISNGAPSGQTQSLTVTGSYSNCTNCPTNQCPTGYTTTYTLPNIGNSITVSGVTISATGSGQITQSPVVSTSLGCSGTTFGTYPVGTITLGSSTNPNLPFTYTLTFNSPVNNVRFRMGSYSYVLAGSNQFQESFTFTTNLTTTRLQRCSGCCSTVTNNTMTATHDPLQPSCSNPNVGNGQGIYQVSSTNGFTTLTITGPGGGTLIQLLDFTT